MKTVKILWSGLTGRTGRAAFEQVDEVKGVEIVAGVKRRESSAEGFPPFMFLYHDEPGRRLGDFVSLARQTQANIIVDFSHPDVFEKMLELAVHMNVPLISGTSGLSNRQMAMLYDATNRIPIFRGGNFRFKVKNFIDEAVKLAMREEGRLDLYENFYKGKSLPSETSKIVQRRVMEATGRTVEVHSADDYGYMNLICNWEFQVHRDESPTNVFMDKVCCRTIGFDELAHDVLEISKVMLKKPIKKGEFYDLDELWDELVSRAI